MVILAMLDYCGNKCILYSIMKIKFIFNAELFITFSGIFFPVLDLLIPIFPGIFVFPFFVHFMKTEIFHKLFLQLALRSMFRNFGTILLSGQAVLQCRELFFGAVSCVKGIFHIPQADNE